MFEQHEISYYREEAFLVGREATVQRKCDSEKPCSDYLFPIDFPTRDPLIILLSLLPDQAVRSRYTYLLRR